MGAYSSKAAGSTASAQAIHAAAAAGGACAAGGALPSTPRCRPAVVVGPSGVGKSTLLKKLQKEFPDEFGFSVSHTTRVDYHFAGIDDVRAEIAQGRFVEHAEVHGNIYGTSKKAVEDVLQKKRLCLLDIDIQGSRTCRSVKLDVGKYIFVGPPSVEELRRRLETRGTETPEAVDKRVSNAAGEIEGATRLSWDAWIVNDDLEEAYTRFRGSLLPLIEECHAARAGST